MIQSLFPDKALSIEGGAMRTVIFIGALMALQHEGLDLNRIKYLHGVSAGAIIGVAIALGISPKKLMEECFDLDFGGLLLNDINESCLTKMLSGDEQFTGCAEGNSIIQKLANIFSKLCPTWHDDMTFKDLEDLTGKQITVTATNLTLKKTVDFSTKINHM